jgi:hypothetical protein
VWLAACAAVILGGLAARQVARTGPAPAAPAPDWQVTLEVVLLSVTAGGALAYRILHRPLPVGADPDAAALAVSGLDRDQPPPGAVSHATSWRAAPGGELVLTYTALPDPASDQAVPLTAPSIICSNDPLRPAPDGLHAHHVAAHGARHLAYLARTDPAVGRCVGDAPAIWGLINETTSAPVAPHHQAHTLAERRTPRLPAGGTRGG